MTDMGIFIFFLHLPPPNREYRKGYMWVIKWKETKRRAWNKTHHGRLGNMDIHWCSTSDHSPKRILGTVSEQTSLKNDSIAKVNGHWDAEHASISGKVSLNMHHLVLFIPSSICWVIHSPYSYFLHHGISELFFTKSKITVTWNWVRP